MADLYTSSYNSHRQQPSYHRHPDPVSSSQQQQQYSQMAYSSQPVSASGHSSSSNGSSEELHEPSTIVKPQDSQPVQKSESKPQATFLTKLYALLERPENHHMIRWDPEGEHIIVERPEQLALHVLPSIYRQSRFASFSRQLNIYGFMRKVNLRNVDPAIDDPDASTWSHPTLNRRSPPEVVANFKRRVPPRLPKPRKRETQDLVSVSIPSPRSAIGMTGQLPTHSSVAHHKSGAGMRARGFSAPGSFTPLSQGGAAGWNTSYPGRQPLPPLTVPSDPPLSHSGIYHQPHHTLHSVTPTDDSPTSPAYSSLPYSSNSSRDIMVNSSSQYHYSDQGNWQFSPVSNGSSSSHSGSLSSLLNPSSSGYSSRPTPTINTSYTSPFASMPMQNDHNASSLSPDSRPTTGYSISSVSSLPYEEHNSSSHHLTHDYGSRPNSSHHRGNSPTRPISSKSSYHNSNSLSVRRQRRHSQAMSPYPSPYDHPDQHHRPSSSPHSTEDHHGSIARVRSMIQLPTVDPYSFNPGHAEFAYSAVPGNVGTTSSVESIDGHSGWNHPGSRSGRPSTSTSSISAASHASSSQANTPDHYGGGGDTDINRFSPDFGFIPMNEHLPPQYVKATGDL